MKTETLQVQGFTPKVMCTGRERLNLVGAAGRQVVRLIPQRKPGGERTRALRTLSMIYP